MTERREHLRKQRTLDFHCYIDGVRFDSPSLDISDGGAFLATADPIPMAATVVLVPRASREALPPGAPGRGGPPRSLLVGRVVRRQGVPRVGVGIRWVKCVSTAGLDALFSFLETVLEIHPSSLPLPEPKTAAETTIAWDFIHRRFETKAKVGGRRGGAAPSAAIPEAPAIPPVAMTRSREEGAITMIVHAHDARVPVDVPVEYITGETIHHGTVIALAATVLTLRLPGDPPPGADRLVLSFPLSYKGQTRLLSLACKNGGVTRAADGAALMDLSIRAVDNEPAPGIFLRYVKYLYFHRVVDDE
jgi:hypothetical protein